MSIFFFNCISGEEYLGVFTASDRVTWAEARNKFFNKGLNKDSLDIIEKAAFVLVLDEDSYGYDPENDLELSRHSDPKIRILFGNQELLFSVFQRGTIWKKMHYFGRFFKNNPKLPE